MSGDVELNPGPVQTENCNVVLSSHARLEQRLRDLNLRPHDVGGQVTAFLDLYHITCIVMQVIILVSELQVLPI